MALTLEDRDAEELILVLCGYHKLLSQRTLEVIQDHAIIQQQQQLQQQEDEQTGNYIIIIIMNKESLDWSANLDIQQNETFKI